MRFESFNLTCSRRWNAAPYAGFRLACHSPLCRYAAWSSLAVSELQLSAATPLWLYHIAASLPSWIEFKCLRSAAVGKAAGLSIYWHDAACRLVIPLRQVALCPVEQISSSKRQCGKREVSLKPALLSFSVLIDPKLQSVKLFNVS